MQFRALAGACLIAFGTASVPLGAFVPLSVTEREKAEEQLATFQKFDQQLQDVGWRLARTNAPFCPDTVASVGLQLQDMASFGRPDQARYSLGLEGDFAVQTAAAGSPAGANPQLAPNAEVTEIAGVNPNQWAADDQLDWKRLKRAHDWIDQTLDTAGSINISLLDEPTITLAAVPVCATRFELAGDNDRALAEGERVVVGIRFEGFGMPEDLFAAALAHELAHNILQHRQWLDSRGRKKKNIRVSEREADRLMPWLLANAGYDPAAAARFLEQYQPSSGGILFFKGTHPIWEERVEVIKAELPVIADAMREEGAADWSAHFKRDIAF